MVIALCSTRGFAHHEFQWRFDDRVGRGFDHDFHPARMKVEQLAHARNLDAAAPHDRLSVYFVQNHHLGGDDGDAQFLDGFIERVRRGEALIGLGKHDF